MAMTNTPSSPQEGSQDRKARVQEQFSRTAEGYVVSFSHKTGKDLQRLIEDTKQFMADATQELREKEIDETQQLLMAIRRVVREFGEEQGYSLILAGGANPAGVLTFTTAVDLTPQVMQRFDQALADRPVATPVGGAPPLARKR